jgi:hypothetical protein
MTGAGREQRGGAPEPIAAVLSRMMGGLRPAARRGGIAETWAAAAGDLAAETKPASLQRGVLTVEVRSAALLAELEGFRKDELLARLLDAEGSGRIRGLRFRLGVF